MRMHPPAAGPSPPRLHGLAQVTPNDMVREATVVGADALPNRVVQSALRQVCGRTLNFVNLKNAVGQLDSWYQDNGVLGQVRVVTRVACQGQSE